MLGFSYAEESVRPLYQWVLIASATLRSDGSARK